MAKAYAPHKWGFFLMDNNVHQNLNYLIMSKNTVNAVIEKVWGPASAKWLYSAFIIKPIGGKEPISEFDERIEQCEDYLQAWFHGQDQFDEIVISVFNESATRVYEKKKINLEEFIHPVGFKSHQGSRDQIVVISNGKEVWVELRDSLYVRGDERFTGGSGSTYRLAQIIYGVREYWINANTPEAPECRTGKYHLWSKPQPIVIIGCKNDGAAWRRVDCERVVDMLTRYPKFAQYMKSLL